MPAGGSRLPARPVGSGPADTWLRAGRPASAPLPSPHLGQPLSEPSGCPGPGLLGAGRCGAGREAPCRRRGERRSGRTGLRAERAPRLTKLRHRRGAPIYRAAGVAMATHQLKPAAIGWDRAGTAASAIVTSAESTRAGSPAHRSFRPAHLSFRPAHRGCAERVGSLRSSRRRGAGSQWARAHTGHEYSSAGWGSFSASQQSKQCGSHVCLSVSPRQEGSRWGKVGTCCLQPPSWWGFHRCSRGGGPSSAATLMVGLPSAALMVGPATHSHSHSADLLPQPLSWGGPTASASLSSGLRAAGEGCPGRGVPVRPGRGCRPRSGPLCLHSSPHGSIHLM